MYSVDHNDIFAHMYCANPGNSFNILNTMLKFQYLKKLFLNFKEALYLILGPDPYIKQVIA